MRLSGAAACIADGPAFEEGSFATLLQAQQWSGLQVMGRLQAFPPGSLLMSEGEAGDHVMVLLVGRVKVTRASVGGREVLLSIRGPGELLGEVSCIDGQPRIASVRALEPAEVLTIDSRRFRRFTEGAPQVASALMKELSLRFRDAVVHWAEFPVSDTIGRLAARLVELADRYGQPSAQGIAIGLPLSQEELGAWVGSSHAGVAKGLQVLRELGWIATERRRIVVRDLDALRGRSA
jgi:CRP-like cAMP-binding protein